MKKKFRGPRKRDFRREEIDGIISVSRRNGENSDSLIRRFKRKLKKSGFQMEVRSRYLERFKSKSEKRREKHRKAVKRAVNKDKK